jgi:hypothetical protein
MKLISTSPPCYVCICMGNIDDRIGAFQFSLAFRLDSPRGSDMEVVREGMIPSVDRELFFHRIGL